MRVLFYIGICMLFFIGISCENNMKEIEALTSSVENVDVYRNIEMTYSDSAQVRVLIKAPLLESAFIKNKISEERFPLGVTVEFFDEKQQPNSWLSAESAQRFPSDDLIVVRDSVVLYSVQGDTLRTDEMFWDSRKGEIYTERVFRYTKANGEKILGRKFRSDQNFEEYTFEQMAGTIQTQFEKKKK